MDTQYTNIPRNRGTGYHNRHSYKSRVHAKYSKPEKFADLQTKKGYFYNAFHEFARSIIHDIKHYEFPFKYETEQEKLNLFNNFIDKYPTLLYTRNHISKINGELKQRPVYAVDELFLTIELMLTFPLHIQARSKDCAIMHGLETIRGGNAYLDKLAQEQNFKSFMTIDWTEFDQRLPRVITDIYFEFLESLITINDGYQPTYEYPKYDNLKEKDMYEKMNNLLAFLHNWYNNMTFVSQDGYAYRRKHAGVPSGLLNTQYLDSFANLYILVDALCEYGCTDKQIEEITFFVMGDDNTLMTHWRSCDLEEFLKFLTEYSFKRYNMKVSINKSIITSLRHKIQTLSYTCNFGRPLKDPIKLLAQLVYPERKPKRHVMSYRAIGIAYAACGQHRKLHEICRNIYTIFLPWIKNMKDEDEIKKYLPSMFTYMEENLDGIDLGKFPDIEDVQQLVSIHQGFLKQEPKWKRSHFTDDPEYHRITPKTMRDYRIENNLPKYK